MQSLYLSYLFLLTQFIALSGGVSTFSSSTKTLCHTDPIYDSEQYNTKMTDVVRFLQPLLHQYHFDHPNDNEIFVLKPLHLGCHLGIIEFVLIGSFDTITITNLSEDIKELLPEVENVFVIFDNRNELHRAIRGRLLKL